MLFLEPTAEEKLAFANLKYDSKTTVWAPCKKTGGFLRGQISGEVDAKGKIAVDCESGEVICYLKSIQKTKCSRILQYF